MKKQITILLLFLTTTLFSQNILWYDCGEWSISSRDTSEWVSIDTLGELTEAELIWVLNEPELDNWNLISESLCPCGCGSDYYYRQKRISINSGVRQTRTIIVRHKYTAKEPTEFEVVESKF